MLGLPNRQASQNPRNKVTLTPANMPTNKPPVEKSDVTLWNPTDASIYFEIDGDKATPKIIYNWRKNGLAFPALFLNEYRGYELHSPTPMGKKAALVLGFDAILTLLKISHGNIRREEITSSHWVSSPMARFQPSLGSNKQSIWWETENPQDHLHFVFCGKTPDNLKWTHLSVGETPDQARQLAGMCINKSITYSAVCSWNEVHDFCCDKANWKPWSRE
jgi:hypothetical protein